MIMEEYLMEKFSALEQAQEETLGLIELVQSRVDNSMQQLTLLNVKLQEYFDSQDS